MLTDHIAYSYGAAESLTISTISGTKRGSYRPPAVLRANGHAAAAAEP